MASSARRRTEKRTVASALRVRDELGRVHSPITTKSVALTPVPEGVVALILPVLAPIGTDVTMTPLSITTNEAERPLNFTLLAPEKLLPVSVTGVSTIPTPGVN